MSTIDRTSVPSAKAPTRRSGSRGTGRTSRGGNVELSPSDESDRDGEKLGLIEALLARERYASVLEIGCGRGDLAAALVDRCARYTGMDVDTDALARARRRVRGEASVRFVPMAVPLALPPGEHELVVLVNVLQLFESSAVRAAARTLAEHRPCREIFVVGTRDEGDGACDPALAAFVAACDGRFAHEQLALRRRYRLDVLLR